MNRLRRHSADNRNQRRFRAFSLAEAVAASAATGVLMLGMGSALMLASHAVPASTEAAGRTHSVAAALSQLAAEVQCATAFSAATPNAIEFLVSDIDGDGLVDTIRYEWDGTRGSPLYRQFNNGTRATLIPSIHEFTMSYSTTSVSSESVADTEGDEVLLGSFLTWSGISSTTGSRSLSASNWVLEWVNINLPLDATAITFTRAQFLLARNSGVGNVTLSVHQRAGIYDNATPGTLIGTPVSIHSSSLSASYQWHEFNLGGAKINSSERSYILLLKGEGSSSAPSGQVQYRYSLSAPADNSAHRFSSNSGSTWNNTVDIHRYDNPFYLYGRYTQPKQVTVTRHHLLYLDVAVQLAGDTTTRMTTGVQTLNHPEVALP